MQKLDKIIVNGYEEDVPAFTNVVYTKCVFKVSLGSLVRDPNKRIVFKNVKFIDCKFHEIWWEGIHFQNVIFDSCEYISINLFNGSAFENVCFKGELKGTLTCNYRKDIARLNKSKMNDLFYTANQSIHEKIDIALDLSKCFISNKKMSELLIGGVSYHRIVTGENAAYISYDKIFSHFNNIRDDLRLSTQVLLDIHNQDFVFIYNPLNVNDMKFVNYCNQEGLTV